MSDTIAAIATAGGIGSIAIVRLSGSDSVTIARHVAPHATFAPRQADLASLYDFDETLIDQGIVLRFAAPNSFTGEEIVEFQCHGGRIIAEAILQTLLHYGARMAKPGEFSRRAFLGGKIDLSEAEAIAKMIEAQSTDAARILARQLKGELGRFVDEVRDALLRALAHSEVMIDYAEEVEDDLVHALLKQLRELNTRMERIVHSSRRRRGLIEGFHVAIIGKPNVGKSALLNALLDYDRAIVSEVAGTTRDTIEEQVRIGTHLIRLIDTAGIRESSDAIEQIGIERSLSSIKEADIVIALFDGNRTFDEEDARIVSLLKNLPHPEDHIVVINKHDLPPVLETQKLARFDPIRISTLNDAEPLIIALQAHLDARGEGEEIMLVSARQIEAVEACQHSITAAEKPLRNGELELFSYHLNEAVAHMGLITRPYENDEMLDRMFGDFCLGK
jgi:tRNA modification GTPase